MDDVAKIAGRHFNYNCKGGFSCTCPGCAGPTRTRIADMVTYIDPGQDVNRASERSHQGAKKVARFKRILLRRAKRKVNDFVMKEALSQD